MNPYYFSSTESPLYGVYHPPTDMGPNEKAVLICPPIGQEYIRTHRALKLLADQLATESCHVFRFDYFGTGDSSGELNEADVNIWIDNIRESITELKDNSGIDQINVIGMRLGAALVASINVEVQNLYFWDPVIDGKKYITSLQEMHQQMLVDNDRFTKPQAFEVIQDSHELLGYKYPDLLMQQIQNISTDTNFNIAAEKLILIKTCNYNHLNGFLDYSKKLRIPVEELSEDMNNVWYSLQNLELAYMPFKIIHKLKKHIVQG